MRYISLFSGIEAATVAWEPLGWTPVAFCEIDKFPSAVLAYHYPDVPNLGDITKVNWNEVIAQYGAVDIIVGGSPCQSFSIAGGRTSLDGESNLMFEYIRAIRDVRPKWLLWENVPGVLNVRDNAFAQLLDELQKLRYGLAWRVLDAKFFGVAQRRKRVFVVGCIAGGGYSAAVLYDSESVPRAAKSEKAHWREIATATYGSRLDETIPVMTNTTCHAAVDNNIGGTLLAGGGRAASSVCSEITGTLTAHLAKGICVDDITSGLLVLEKRKPLG